jgi:hypothetical protein
LDPFQLIEADGDKDDERWDGSTVSPENGVVEVCYLSERQEQDRVERSAC